MPSSEQIGRMRTRRWMIVLAGLIGLGASFRFRSDAVRFGWHLDPPWIFTFLAFVSVINVEYGIFILMRRKRT
jgi:hypothetical protein